VGAWIIFEMDKVYIFGLVNLSLFDKACNTVRLVLCQYTFYLIISAVCVCVGCKKSQPTLVSSDVVYNLLTLMVKQRTKYCRIN